MANIILETQRVRNSVNDILSPEKADEITQVIVDVVTRNNEFEGTLTQAEAEIIKPKPEIRVIKPETTNNSTIEGWFLRVVVIDDQGRVLEVDGFLDDPFLDHLIICDLFVIMTAESLINHSPEGEMIVNKLKPEAATEKFLVKTSRFGQPKMNINGIRPYFGSK